MRDTAIAIRKDEQGAPNGVIVLTADYDEYDEKWVGTILELGVSTYADSLKDLRHELSEATLLQLNEVERLGYMDEYLIDHGVKVLALSAPQNNLEALARWDLAAAGV